MVLFQHNVFQFDLEQISNLHFYLKYDLLVLTMTIAFLLSVQKLEEEFFRQREEQEKFYGAVGVTGDGGDLPNMPMYSGASSSSLRSGKDSMGSVSSRHSTII
jgi:hypothetical protein